MLVAHILKTKGDMVFTVGPDETVAAAARLLGSRRVGAMVVMGGGEVIGILSERDVTRVVADAGAAGLDRPVSEFMSREVVFADPDETVDQLMTRMTDRRIRHLPVCQGGRLVGIVSIGDLVKVKISEAEAESADLRAYIAAG